MKGNMSGLRARPCHLKLLCSLFLALFVFIMFCGPGRVLASDAGLAIKDVSTDRTTLGPGEKVFISFRLTQDARVYLQMYDPDYEVARRVLDGQKRAAGTITVPWDGRDDAGILVPDEVYIFTILAETSTGRRAKYDPTAYSGGERLMMKMDRVERSSGNYTMYYSVPQPARITIRAGIHKGPLLKTILDWKPMPPGEYSATWDGLDETGQIRVMDESDSILYVTGFRLSENAIIVHGSGKDYSEYKERRTAKAASSSQTLTYAEVRRAALERRDKDISPRYLVRRAFNEAPKFRVSLARQFAQRTAVMTSEEPGLAETPVTDVSGQVKLKIEVAPESVRGFNEYRHEIVVFVDNERFDEEESAYTPYTYHLDTRKLSNGEHAISVNLVNLSGPIGCYSFRIDVNN